MINIVLTKCAAFSQDDKQNEQIFSQDDAQRSAVRHKIVFLNRYFSPASGVLRRFCIIMRASAVALALLPLVLVAAGSFWAENEPCASPGFMV